VNLESHADNKVVYFLFACHEKKKHNLQLVEGGQYLVEVEIIDYLPFL